jgi:hypothetical protein
VCNFTINVLVAKLHIDIVHLFGYNKIVSKIMCEINDNINCISAQQARDVNRYKNIKEKLKKKSLSMHS